MPVVPPGSAPGTAPDMQDHARTWLRQRTSHWQDWPPERLLAAKHATGTRISVVIPARNEERTVGRVVAALRQALLMATPLVDEIIVVDSDSTDGTARAAERAGAVVHRARDIAPALGSYPGKGEALWKSLLVTQGDLLVFVDADLTRWGPHFVTGLLGPLLADRPGAGHQEAGHQGVSDQQGDGQHGVSQHGVSQHGVSQHGVSQHGVSQHGVSQHGAGQQGDGQPVQLVKGFYERVRTERDGSTSTEGGRVTELVARPLLSLWWPQLAGVVQPLAGEWAIRRDLMESLSIPVGYGVELSTLLDTFGRYGLGALAQVDLGSRAHRHQADHDLALMAAELLIVAEARRAHPESPGQLLHQFVRENGEARPRSRAIPSHERPPASTVKAAR
jgi:glucosyl-3-phosphoglycerate synthase